MGSNLPDKVQIILHLLTGKGAVSGGFFMQVFALFLLFCNRRESPRSHLFCFQKCFHIRVADFMLPEYRLKHCHVAETENFTQSPPGGLHRCVLGTKDNVKVVSIFKQRPNIVRLEQGFRAVHLVAALVRFATGAFLSLDSTCHLRN